ncbi:MAG: NAD(P)H-binding protein [Pseudomonadota bacterium]
MDGQRFDFVFSCLASRTGAPDDAWRVDHDANQNLLSLCRRHSVQQFILLSAICVQKPRLAFQHAKLAFEQALERSGVPYSIVRPTAFFKSLSGQLDRVRAGKPFLLFGDGTLTACKPIAELDLADYLIDCLENPERMNQVLPIGGPGPALTARDQGALLFEQVGKPPKFRSVSPNLLSGIAALLTPFGKLVPAIAAKSEFARIGHYYATESMLLWDAAKQNYDALATPVGGSRTLQEHYAQLVSEGIAGHEAHEHKMF